MKYENEFSNTFRSFKVSLSPQRYIKFKVNKFWWLALFVVCMYSSLVNVKIIPHAFVCLLNLLIIYRMNCSSTNLSPSNQTVRMKKKLIIYEKNKNYD